MARCLIIGCGCRGRSLALTLLADGHAVRGTTRSSARVAELEAAGVEAHIGDPDRVATMVPALDHVAIACILLGSASGPDASLAALHGSRLEMLLLRMTDTTVHGIVYEAAGSVDRDLLQGGAQRVQAACADAKIPHVLLDADPARHHGWTRAGHDAVSRLLEGASGD